MRALRLADQMETLRHLLGTRGTEPAAYTIQAACNEIEDLRTRKQETEAEAVRLQERLKAAEDVCHAILDTIVRFTGVRQ